MKKLIYILLFSIVAFSCKTEKADISGSWLIEDINYTNPESTIFLVAYVIENKVEKLDIKDGIIHTLDYSGKEIDKQNFNLESNKIKLGEKSYPYSLIDDRLIINFDDVELKLVKNI